MGYLGTPYLGRIKNIKEVLYQVSVERLRQDDDFWGQNELCGETLSGQGGLLSFKC